MLLQLPSEKAWLDCTRCDLHKVRTRVVIGYGNTKADVIFIESGPKGAEEAEGRPLAGHAGERLDDFLDILAIPRDTVFVDGILGCRCPYTINNGEEKDRPPKKEEIAACLDRVLEAIYNIDPVLIVALGDVPLKALTGDTSSISKARGGIFECHIPGLEMSNVVYPVLATLHPSALKSSDRRKTGGTWEYFFEDMKLVKAIINETRKRYFGLTPKG